MSDEPVNLAFMARQFRRVLDEMAGMREEMHVQTAILLRLDRRDVQRDEYDIHVRNQMSAMAAQQQRFGDRLAALDERVQALEDEQNQDDGK